jgi:hypothetical protein
MREWAKQIDALAWVFKVMYTLSPMTRIDSFFHEGHWGGIAASRLGKRLVFQVTLG